MRKPQMAGRRPSDRIIVRTERVSEDPRTKGPAMQAETVRKTVAARGPSARQGATMDYQMGFASGSSH